MFVRVKTNPDSPRKAVQLVESVRRKIVRHIGTALDADELTRLKDTENRTFLFPSPKYP